MIHRAKKSLGQNFLHSKGAIRSIIEASELKKGETAFEIGPGKGALTDELLKTGAHVIAIEKDGALFEYLSEKFAQEIKKGQFDLIHGDVEDSSVFFFKLQTVPYKLVANIPYNLTGYIIRTFLESDIQPSKMVLLVQKEVAERIVARSKPGLDKGKESILSLSVKLYGNPRYIAKVPARFFRPMPKVDSAIISVENIDRSKLTYIQEKGFFDLIHSGFAHKRKVLLSNLTSIAEKSKLETLFKALSIDSKARAEDLTLLDWINITKSISKS